MNMKKINIINSLVNYYSLDSSVLAALCPPPPLTLLEPNMSSHVKFKVKRAGKMPSPITKPFYLFPNNEFPA
jgi:hypothetical protein